jgi:hypothetical protein
MVVARVKGAMVLEDYLVTCRYNTATQLDLICEAINTETGWDMDVAEATRPGSYGSYARSS